MLFLLLIVHLAAFSLVLCDDGDDWKARGVGESSEGIRSKRYVVRKKRWRKQELTWTLDPQNIDESDSFTIRNTLHRSFNEWQSVSSVTFREASDGEIPDIHVAFERGHHDDDFPFDGQDGIVAHAFYPRDGRLHFDADEKWTLNTDEGVNLFQTAVHEIGHLLGLEHSQDSRAAMYGTRRSFDPDFTLGDDDVRAIRMLFPLKQPSKSAQEKPSFDTSDYLRIAQFWQENHLKKLETSKEDDVQQRQFPFQPITNLKEKEFNL